MVDNGSEDATNERFHFGGEEQLLATDLTTAGGAVRYVPELPVHHHPSTVRDRAWISRRGVRNTLWFLWLRRSPAVAISRSWDLLHEADSRTAAVDLGQALVGIPWVLRNRDVVPPDVARDIRLLEQQRELPDAGRYGDSRDRQPSPPGRRVAEPIPRNETVTPILSLDGRPYGRDDHGCRRGPPSTTGWSRPDTPRRR